MADTQTTNTQTTLTGTHTKIDKYIDIYTMSKKYFDCILNGNKYSKYGKAIYVPSYDYDDVITYLRRDERYIIGSSERKLQSMLDYINTHPNKELKNADSLCNDVCRFDGDWCIGPEYCYYYEKSYCLVKFEQYNKKHKNQENTFTEVDYNGESAMYNGGHNDTNTRIINPP